MFAAECNCIAFTVRNFTADVSQPVESPAVAVSAIDVDQVLLCL